MSDYIPDHLLAHVLLRLPVDSLLRFRCVSKSWRALIDSSGFIKMHLSNALQEANSPNGIKIIAWDRDNFYTLDLDLEAHSSTATASAKQLNCSFRYQSNIGVRFIGSCNGLLCLKYPWERNILLWNPWIQKSWSFPYESSVCIAGENFFLHGFGYDRVNDDYKVLSRYRYANLDYGDLSDWLDEVYVYSCKLNTWKRLEHFPFKSSAYHCYCAPDCILANCALHWFMREKTSNGASYIISFDLSSEEFQKLPCPRYPEDSIRQNLSILNECLCLITYYKVGGRFAVDLWLMEEYGVGESWTKLTSITMPLGWKCWGYTPLVPLALSKNKRQLLLQIGGEMLVLHDLETKCISDLAIAGDTNFLQSSCTCIGSLVRPFGID